MRAAQHMTGDGRAELQASLRRVEQVRRVVRSARALTRALRDGHRGRITIQERRLMNETDKLDALEAVG
jgi:hypothetical protein